MGVSWHMGVVRLDDRLLKEIRELLKKEENKYKYGSISSFINYVIFQELNKGVKK